MTEKDILKLVGNIADRNNLSVWAVGGFVRDKFLNKSVKDIDFAVVGDGPEFARAIAKELQTNNVIVYEKFGTAMIHFQDYRLEFVSTRKENYHEDSRNPMVTQTTLEKDLLRRDFTINAIAFGLNKNNFGEIYDPLGGQKALKKKLLHTPLDPVVTFKDDPLRIMRAIRFAAQLNFKIETKAFQAIKKMNNRLKNLPTNVRSLAKQLNP